jgi:hypothetical protein
MFTYDRRTIDAAGAFLIGELERLDKTLNLPLTAVTWQRDIDLREDVTMEDETTSFTHSTFAAPGGVSPTGKNFIGKSSTAIPGIALNIGKFPSPLHTWGMELAWTIIELAAAQKLGRPIDSQKYEGMQLKYNLDVDAMVYEGDREVGAVGLVNHPGIATGNSTLDWDTATPKEILDEVNDLLLMVWKNTAHAVMPDQLRLPPAKMARLTQPVTAAGSISLLKYISEQCLTYAETGKTLDIKSLKWLDKTRRGGTDRVLAYSRDKKYVRFPLVPMRSTPLEHRGLYQLTIYYCKLGHVEFVYPETLGYMDGS